MTTPKSRLAYQMHYDILDRALSDDRGIRIKQIDAGKAWRLRLEFHHARGIDRDDNQMAYEEGHPMHGVSIYDKLLITIDHDTDGQVWLYIHKRDISTMEIESLSTEPKALEPEPEPEFEEQFVEAEQTELQPTMQVESISEERRF